MNERDAKKCPNCAGENIRVLEGGTVQRASVPPMYVKTSECHCNDCGLMYLRDDMKLREKLVSVRVHYNAQMTRWKTEPRIETYQITDDEPKGANNG